MESIQNFNYSKARFVNIQPKGKGAFSQVFQVIYYFAFLLLKANVEQTGEIVAIKRLKKDKKFKNRET